MVTMKQLDKNIEVAERVKFCCFCGKKINWKKDYQQKVGKDRVEIVCRKCNTCFIVKSRKLEEDYKEGS